MNNIDQNTLRSVVENVLVKLNGGAPLPAGSPTSPAPTPAPAAAAPEAHTDCACHGTSPGNYTGKNGVFQSVEEAAEAAQEAFVKFQVLGTEGRKKVIEIVKDLCVANAEPWGTFEMNETKIGRLDHKIEKLKIVPLVPGVEYLRPDAMSGDHGIMLEEFAPYGVVGAILPVTHSVPTLTGNVINILAAGNTVLFNPHPGGAKSAAMATRAYNQAIFAELGVDNLICTIEEPSIESFNEICANKHIAIMAITGGPAVVEAAMQSGKRSICAGPGNPVVVVDETANIERAATAIIAGASFDNNLLCIGEKAVFVVSSVFDSFMAAMEKAGAVRLNEQQLEKLSLVAFNIANGEIGRAHV